MLLRFIESTALSSGQRLDNVNQIHLVLASGKLVLQKSIAMSNNPDLFKKTPLRLCWYNGDGKVELLPGGWLWWYVTAPSDPWRWSSRCRRRPLEFPRGLWPRRWGLVKKVKKIMLPWNSAKWVNFYFQQKTCLKKIIWNGSNNDPDVVNWILTIIIKNILGIR